MTFVPQVEYLGFHTGETTRDYRLAVRQADGQCDEFVIAIELEAFLSRRVRYQDAAEICFRQLQSAMEARALAPESPAPARRQTVTDETLRDYRETHAPKVRQAATPRPATT